MRGIRFVFWGGTQPRVKRQKWFIQHFLCGMLLPFSTVIFLAVEKEQIAAVQRKGNELSYDCKKEISFFLFAWLVQNLQTDWNPGFLFYPFILQNIRFAVSLSKLSAESRTGQLLSCKWEFLLLNNCFAAFVFTFTDSIFLLQNTICKYKSISFVILLV